jgi:hypothetical protein
VAKRNRPCRPAPGSFLGILLDVPNGGADVPDESNSEPDYIYIIAWRTSDPRSVNTLKRGLCALALCVECKSEVAISGQAIKDVSATGCRIVPICQNCALSPAMRERFAAMPLMTPAGMSTEDMNAFIASLRMTPEGFGTN